MCTDEEAIQHCTELKGIVPFKEKCRQAGVSYSSATAYRNNKKCTDEEAIKHCKELKGTVPFKEKCRQAGVSCESVRWYKRSTGCSYEEAIQHYMYKIIKKQGDFELCTCIKCNYTGLFTKETKVEHLRKHLVAEY